MGLVAPRHVGSSLTRDGTHIPCIGRWILNHYATREVPEWTTLICNKKDEFQKHCFRWKKPATYNCLCMYVCIYDSIYMISWKRQPYSDRADQQLIWSQRCRELIDWKKTQWNFLGWLDSSISWLWRLLQNWYICQNVLNYTFKLANLTVCQLYFNKADFKKSKEKWSVVMLRLGWSIGCSGSTR